MVRSRVALLAGWFSLQAAVGIAAELQLRVLDDADRPVADAVVYAVPRTPSTRPPRPAVMDQVDRQFMPRVLVIQRGAAVQFPNRDNIRHQVYSFSPANRFTLKLYAGRPANPVVFPEAGVVVLGCNIHDSMVAWVLVVDTPYFARTDAAGAATLTGLEAGDYELRAWRASMTSEPAGEALSVGAANPGPRTLHVPAAPPAT